MSLVFKKLVASIVTGLLVVPNVVPQQVPSTRCSIRLRKGTVLKFKTLKAVTSTTAKAGDEVPLRLDRALIVDGKILLEAGELASGHVSKVKRAGPNARDGEVKLKVEKIYFYDASAVKSKVWFQMPGDAEVPEKYFDLRSDRGIGGLSTGEEIGLSVITIIFLPLILIKMMFEKRGPYPPGTEYDLPADSTVAVAIANDHHVRY